MENILDDMGSQQIDIEIKIKEETFLEINGIPCRIRKGVNFEITSFDCTISSDLEPVEYDEPEE